MYNYLVKVIWLPKTKINKHKINRTTNCWNVSAFLSFLGQLYVVLATHPTKPKQDEGQGLSHLRPNNDKNKIPAQGHIYAPYLTYNAKQVSMFFLSKR